ncbi:hypothetical protein VFPPC_09836 [Pochonia chlamydosporia 170]|uniref:Uncharacterized protein n=1 Tax=Pochonia chlamydosporia 170 TaxID=1380566 RepID=A0A179FEI5_METCM|nr:hypothetical protein VFPPC_09836 [Pochonia chlamydosporia 170]OAQ63483.1 hypothetical protein VFPPC_09836 [Pochonia chlamydosporia 170]
MAAQSKNKEATELPARLSEEVEADTEILKVLKQLRDGQHLIVGLLTQKLNPYDDILQLSQKLWNSEVEVWSGTERRWHTEKPQEAVIGKEFLNYLVPSGITLEKDRHSGGVVIGSVQNLLMAREALMKGGTDLFSTDDQTRISMENLKNKISPGLNGDLWPKIWQPLRIRDYDNCTGVYYAIPRSFDDPFYYILDDRAEVPCGELEVRCRQGCTQQGEYWY